MEAGRAAHVRRVLGPGHVCAQQTPRPVGERSFSRLVGQSGEFPRTSAPVLQPLFLTVGLFSFPPSWLHAHHIEGDLGEARGHMCFHTGKPERTPTQVTPSMPEVGLASWFGGVSPL